MANGTARWVGVGVTAFVLAATFGIAWGTNRANIAETSKAVAVLGNTVNNPQEGLVVSRAIMQTTQTQLKEDVGEIKTDIKLILKKLKGE